MRHTLYIAVVERYGVDLDEDFVGCRGGHGGFGQLEGVDALEGGLPLLDRHFLHFLVLFLLLLSVFDGLEV